MGVLRGPHSRLPARMGHSWLSQPFLTPKLYCVARLVTSERLIECLKAPGSLLDLLAPILGAEESRLAGTLP